MRGEYWTRRFPLSRIKELPPRARRILGDDDLALTPQGTTSACAENTSPPTASHAPKGNYLRVRGEYLDDTANTCGDWELPPRARRIPPFWPGMRGGSGTTSACAENTFTKQLDGIMIRNYLRVRGEYYIYRNLASGGGTTSACAENTKMPASAPSAPWNYLRVRGEYTSLRRASSRILELPPRARRIRFSSKAFGGRGGTTSACAENTAVLFLIPAASRNYLRVRGEYFPREVYAHGFMELPPRARRIHLKTGAGVFKDRTTSACAENTGYCCCYYCRPGNYLRVRGEYPK